jgi:ribosomal protein S27AE
LSPAPKRARASSPGHIPPIRLPARNPRASGVLPPPVPRLVADSRESTRVFTHEAHRAVGAVVRQLLPRCPHCGPGYFCSDDTDPNAPKPKKLRSLCYRCGHLHEKCEPWLIFRIAFNEQDRRALGRFRFEFWEHLGEGRYQLLLPDPCLEDLHSLCTSFLLFVSGFFANHSQ